MENKILKQQANIDEKGQLQNYMTAQPIRMQCEARGCGKTEGHDYKRKGIKSVWSDEPIFLCDEHAKGYTKI